MREIGYKIEHKEEVFTFEKQGKNEFKRENPPCFAQSRMCEEVILLSSPVKKERKRKGNGNISYIRRVF